MIESISVPLEDFDLLGFLDAYRRFHREWAGTDDAELSVVIQRKHGDIPLPVYEDRDLADELLYRGWLLFFPVHEPLVTETALCIDGVRRNSRDFDSGVAGEYGFVVEVREGVVSLHPALYDGSGNVPSLDLQGRCGLLDECMDKFVRRFIMPSG
jgi:hypothetical protein